MIKNLILLSFLLITGNLMAEKPNVVMIVLDDLNDYVGVMGGHPQAKTPNIDRLAGQGILFNNAHSNAPVCSPSRASFMTGISPLTSRNYGFKNWLQNSILLNSKTIPEYIRENGYDAYQTGKILHNKKNGIWTQQGEKTDYGPFAFDGKKVALHPATPEGMAPLGALDSTFASLADTPEVNGHKGWVNNKWNKTTPFRYVSDEDRDLMTDEKSLEWFKSKMAKLEKNKNAKPFFFAVGIIRPHTPLVVPQKYFDMFPLDKITLPEVTKDDISDCKLAEANGGTLRGRQAYYGLIGKNNDRQIHKKYIQSYLASVAFADEMVGGILATIEQSRFKENTVVMLFSDHGYSLGEKEYLWKYNLWEESTRVPLIIKHPKYTANAGKTVDHPVSLIDIFPTVKEICSLTGPTKINSKGADIDGHSLVPFLENPQTEKWEGPKVAITSITSYKSLRPEDQHLSIRSKDFRYIRYANGSEELYDHRKDSHEWLNLAENPEYSSIKNELKNEMEKLIQKSNSKSSSSTVTEKTGEEWKDIYFKKFPEADTNKDGELSWPEFHAHKKMKK